MPERVILEIGAEGGSLTLVENGKTPPRFSARLRDQSMLFLEEGPAIEKKSEWMTWSKALKALGRYPWAALYPVEVAREYGARIWSLVRAASKENEHVDLERWAERCGIDPSVARRVRTRARPAAKKARAPEPSRETTSVQLVRKKGDTSIFVDATIDADGDLVLSGQELGAAPNAVFGSSEYEYALTVKAKDKDALLLALLEALYRNDAQVVSRLKRLAASKKIRTAFFSP